MAHPQSELLPPERSLRFPAFETYRLHPLDDVPSFALPGEGATQSRVQHSAQQQLGFKEVRARIAHNHLDTAGARGVYVDTEWNVVGFELDTELQPTFSQLASLPVPIGGDQHAEYPRALALSPTCWAVSSGSGSLYVLEVSPPGSAVFEGRFVARHDLVRDADGDGNTRSGAAPFLLCAAHADGSGLFHLLIARAAVQPDDSGAAAGKFTARRAEFELAQVEISGTPNGLDAAPGVLVPQWVLRGGDLPYWATWAEADGGWVVLSEETFTARPAAAEPLETDAERAEREHKERVAKLGLGASLVEDDKPREESGGELEPQVDTGPMDVDDDKQYPFRWTQDTDSVTITVPLPRGTSRKDIDLQIAPDVLSVSLSVVPDALQPPLAAFVARKTHTFWSTVVADESTWTYAADTGELTVELQKTAGDTRWPSVFVPSDDGDDDDDDDDAEDVPETFAPATLAALRESFSHASGVRPRAGAAPDDAEDELPDTVPTLPALLREEMDLDFDPEDDYGEHTDGAFSDLSAGTVGRVALIGFVSADGSASWSRQPAAVLSLPASADAGAAAGADAGPTIIVKEAVDGLLFAPPRSSNPAHTAWTHLGTNPALAFVMSSKRDLRLVRHVVSAGAGTGATVLGFESGSGTGNGNVYVYYAPTAPGAGTARQGVLGVSGGERGALLGVGCVRAPGGGAVVVALCERALAVLRGVLP